FEEKNALDTSMRRSYHGPRHAYQQSSPPSRMALLPRTSPGGAMSEPARVATGKGHAFSASPVLDSRLPAWRSRLVLLVMFAAFATLAGRAVWLQLGSSEFLQKQGAARYARTLELPATRGRILDRNGEVLALSLPARAVWAIPAEARAAPAGQRDALARLLGLD